MYPISPLFTPTVFAPIEGAPSQKKQKCSTEPRIYNIMNSLDAYNLNDILNNHLIPAISEMGKINSLWCSTRTDKSYRVLACLSKVWNLQIKNLNLEGITKNETLIKQLKIPEHQRNFEKEFLYLLEVKKIEALVNLVMNPTPRQDQSIESLINYFNQNKYEVADLRNYSCIENEILERLLEECPNINHLILGENQVVTKLPDACSRLETLDCSQCFNLQSLPSDMKALTHLDCSNCPKLQNLPSDMTALTTLNCKGCLALDSLPNSMINLKELDCSGCNKLQHLPINLKALITLDCSDCFKLDSLPNSMTNLKELDCSFCLKLEELLDRMDSLIKLNCSYCSSLQKLPTSMISLQNLNSKDCRSLSSMEIEMPHLHHYEDSGQLYPMW